MRHFCLALNHHEKTAINLIVNVLIDSKFSVYGTVDVLHDPSSQATVPIRLSHLGDETNESEPWLAKMFTHGYGFSNLMFDIIANATIYNRYAI